eukprot:CCRYP_019398-RC/>CCRYP_019398-RC protein AED:0.48 eAED:1.00 QI:0/0/0/1/0/0/2/0/62
MTTHACHPSDWIFYYHNGKKIRLDTAGMYPSDGSTPARFKISIGSMEYFDENDSSQDAAFVL